MDIAEIQKLIGEWANSEPLVKRVYIFGSRARTDFHKNSDLDVAVEIRKGDRDENVLTTWIHEGKGMEIRLAKVVPFKLQLELFDGMNTSTVLNGIKQSSILVYEKV